MSRIVDGYDCFCPQLHLSGGRGYHVFSSASDGRVALFDTLLHLCAYRGHSLLVDYAYATRFASKPGVLVPHLQKHCFVFFDLIYQDNMNYLPRYVSYMLTSTARSE